VKSGNINRFKELFLWTAFLVLLFSFSNKALSKSNEGTKQTEQCALQYKNTETIINAGSFVIQASDFLNSSDHFLFNFKKFNLLTENAKIKFAISYFTKSNLLSIAPTTRCRFYYQTFSLKSEESPSIG